MQVVISASEANSELVANSDHSERVRFMRPFSSKLLWETQFKRRSKPSHPLLFGIFCLLTTFGHVAIGKDFIAKEPATPASEFGLTIRSTPFRSALDEQKLLYVPEGFEIELVASEPVIVKPLNLAFDKRGKLWVSQTHLYPFPAKEGEKASDSIVVLEDKDGDGSFESKTVFADDLNIPMGLLPVEDGVICFSIPNIWYLKDTNADGICDERQILYGPFDTSRDTHGLVNSIRDGGDGWIYACHGFNNQSRVSGTDGHTVWLPSGNVFRFKKDGSRIELYTQGQVNPFGMTQDEWGNWFSADCHSKPISQLIQGGSYQSFGRPHDGLGFAPDIMDHLHGSTAIAGLAHTIDSRFPSSMSNQLLSGNVMTCRVNRNQLVYRGATAKAVEMPDLVTSDDPWFRPVDLTFGPDGSLYIADFYNSIIGHYEVPLDHPGRDRTSGRIWRVRWKGTADEGTASGNRQVPPVHSWKELSKLNIGDTKDAMSWCHSIQTLSARTDSQSPWAEALEWFVTNHDLVEQSGDPVLKQTYLIAFRRTLQNFAKSDSTAFTNSIESIVSRTAEKNDASSTRLTHVLLNVLPACHDARCSLAAIRLLQRIADKNQAISKTDDSDLQQGLGEFAWGVERIAEVVDDEAIEPFLELIKSLSRTKKHGSTNQQNLSFARQLVSIGERQLTTKGGMAPQLHSVAKNLIDSLAINLLSELSTDASSTISLPLFTVSDVQNDKREWGLEVRDVVVGSNASEVQSQFIRSSFNLGESYSGRLISPPFQAPGVFRFNIAGHSGIPPAKLGLNKVRLSLWAPETQAGKVLFEQVVPVNDVAQPVTWELGDDAGKYVILEIIDGDANPSFAWIGVGNFSDSRFASSEQDEQWQVLTKLIDLFGYPESSQPMFSLLESKSINQVNKFLLLKQHLRSRYPTEVALVELAIETRAWDILFKDFGISRLLNYALNKSTNSEDQSVANEFAKTLFSRLSASEQNDFVQRLSQNRSSLLQVANWIQGGLLPVEVLATLPETVWASLGTDELAKFAPLRERLTLKKDRSEVLAATLEQVRSQMPDRQLGKKVFADKCAQCHKFDGLGQVVGPQLEGVGNRGMERLLEDIIWPDRNVDEAFRVTLLLLADGSTVNGLVVDRNDKTLTIVDQVGKRFVVPIEDIDEEKHSVLSLMPSNLEDVMTPKELASLLDYLRHP